MDSIFLILGFFCVIIGIIGSIIPVLPGISISWLGLLLLYLTAAIPMNYWILGITLLITVILLVIDYILPSKSTKKFGGSSYGIWGTNIGLIIGILSPIPAGFLIGPFVGALMGELIFNPKDPKKAVRAATGSLVGLLASSFIQFVVAIIYLGLFLTIVWQNKSALF